MKCLYLGLLILVTVLSVTRAQMWESTNGPSGGNFFYATIGPDKALYVLSKSLYRSADEGATWSRVGQGIINTTGIGHKAKFLWSTSGAMFLIMPNQLLKSTDNGGSWEMIRSVGLFVDLAISPTGNIVISSNDSVFVSSDDGTTWNDSRPSSQFRNGSVFIDQVGTIFTSDGYDIFRSIDNGQSWLKIENLAYGGYPHIHPFGDSTLLLAYRNTLHSSSDRGKTWAPIHTTSQRMAKVTAAGSDTICVVTEYGGIEWTTDAGKTWKLLGKYSGDPYTLFIYNTKLYSIFQWEFWQQNLLPDYAAKQLSPPNGRVRKLLPTRTPKLFAITGYEEGIFGVNFWTYSAITGWNTEPSFIGDYVLDIGIDSLDSVYAVIGGRFAQYSEATLDWDYGKEFIGYHFDIEFGNDHIFVAGDSNLWRTSNRGLNWTTIRHPLHGRQLKSLAVTSNVMYAGGQKFLIRSINDGQTWEEPVFPFITNSGIVRAIECRDSIVIVGVDLTGVYFSSDQGTIWENHSQGLGLDTIIQLLATPEGTVFAATTSGVYEYAPSTQMWSNVNDGTLFGTVLSLALGTDGKVYVGTDGDGVYRSTKTYGSWVSKVHSDEYVLNDISLYPNPASTVLSVSFKSGRPETYRAAIYNLLGESILVSNNEETIDVSSLHSGQYFLRITTDSSIQTLPLSIIK